VCAYSTILGNRTFSLKMGVPFSKEVDIVVNSMQDLKPIAATALQTVKYIAPLLLLLQIATLFLVALLLAAVIALIFTMDPDLSEERKALVTPVLKSLAKRLLKQREGDIAELELEPEAEHTRLARDTRSLRLKTVSSKEI
jgi:hypothetical protein